MVSQDCPRYLILFEGRKRVKARGIQQQMAPTLVALLARIHLSFGWQDSKLCPSPNLEWFPSLELDDARALDMVDHFFDEPTGAALYVKREC